MSELAHKLIPTFINNIKIDRRQINLNLLEIENLTKLFPGVVALDNVDFLLNDGEVHCILGENGAGKSTLVKILSGAYKNYEGRILICGEEVKIGNPIESRNLGIAAIQQHRDLVPTMNGIENIFLGREIHKRFILDKRKSEGLARKITDRFDKTINLDVKVSELTVAQQEIVTIAKALIQKCNILLLDEATVPFDVSSKKVLFEIIRELKTERNMGIVFISHNIEELFEIGDIITILRDGKKICTKKITDININEAIRLMIGRKKRKRFAKKEYKIGNTFLELKNINIPGFLKNINLNIRRGEILGIAGNPDSHKEMIAEIAFGLIKNFDGEMLLNGNKVKGIFNPKFAIEKGVGFLPVDRHNEGLVLSRPVFENVSITWLNKEKRFFNSVSRLFNITKKFVKELSIKTQSPLQRVEYLSGGNQQKVVMAKWMAADCDLLFLLEPTVGIDVETRWEIYKILNNLVEEGKAIVVISSDLDEILAISNRIIIMKGGSILEIVDTRDVTKEYISEKIILPNNMNNKVISNN